MQQSDFLLTYYSKGPSHAYAIPRAHGTRSILGKAQIKTWIIPIAEGLVPAWYCTAVALTHSGDGIIVFLTLLSHPSMLAYSLRLCRYSVWTRREYRTFCRTFLKCIFEHPADTCESQAPSDRFSHPAFHFDEWEDYRRGKNADQLS